MIMPVDACQCWPVYRYSESPQPVNPAGAGRSGIPGRRPGHGRSDWRFRAGRTAAVRGAGGALGHQSRR